MDAPGVAGVAVQGVAVVGLKRPWTVPLMDGGPGDEGGLGGGEGGKGGLGGGAGGMREKIKVACASSAAVSPVGYPGRMVTNV